MTSTRQSYNRYKGKAAAYLRGLVGHPGRDCITYPFALDTKGYGQVGFGGRVLRAHRFMCELANGPPPSPDHHAAHSCGNGNKGCVNPNHLSWKTVAENAQDRIAMGRQSKSGRIRAKLCAAQVTEIIALKGKVPQERIALVYGVSRETVNSIHCGRVWKSVAR